MEPLTRKSSAVGKLVLPEAMSLLILELAFVEIAILVAHHSERNAVLLELTLEDAAIMVDVSAHMFLVVTPNANKYVFICVGVSTLTFLQSVNHGPFIDLAVLVLYSTFSRQGVILKFSFIK